MGNSHNSSSFRETHPKKSENDEYLSNLSSDESSQLVSLFESLSPNSSWLSNSTSGEIKIKQTPTSKSQTKISIEELFYMANVENFGFILWQSGFFKDVKTFQKNIVSLTRISSSVSLKNIWDIIEFSHTMGLRSGSIVRDLLILVFDISYRNTLKIKEFSPVIDNIIIFISKFCSKEEFSILFSDFESWANNFASFFAKVIETYFRRVCWKDESSPDFVPFVPPLFVEETSAIVQEYEMMPLALNSDRLQGAWKRLYTSETDGLSFNRLSHHILGYDGPLCILIKVRGERRTIIGGYSDDRWKESNRFYGTYRDFVFAMEPGLKICRSRNDGNMAYRWLNTKSYSQPHGLGFGGTVEQFRIFIPESLEGCSARTTCLTYEPGKLLPDNKLGDESFEIDVVEAWACGGERAVGLGMKSQAQHRGVAQEVINKARKVDKAAFFNNSFDQEFLLSNTLKHREAGSDRTGS